nr:DUF2336 domain-containing protein [Roseibium sp. RKSG952]
MQEHLLDLARLKAPEARSELVRQLMAEYHRSGDRVPTEVEKDLFCKIVVTVFDQLSTRVRAELAAGLARTEHLTPELADKLAFDQFDISRPVIESCKSVSHDTLLRLAREGSDLHRMALASRHDLTEDISDVLVARGARTVCHILLANLAAPISLRASVAILIFATHEHDTLAALAKRALQDQAFRKTQEQIIETRFPMVPPVLVSAIETDGLDRLAASCPSLKNDPVRLFARAAPNTGPRQWHLPGGDLSFDALVQALLNEDRLDAVIWLISRELGLSLKAVTETVHSHANITIMMLLLQAGISTRTYRCFLERRCALLDRGTREIPALVSRFKSERQRQARQAG